MLKKVITCLWFIICSLSGVYSQQIDPQQDAWVDSVFQQMTPDERLGQLFMVAAYSNRNEAHYSSIENLIKKYNIGGLIFFQGGPVRQATLTNRYQKAAKVPLLLAMDAEWGLGMRLDSTINFPKQMTLGAIQDNALIYKMGKEIAYQFRALGMHVNFAPVVDVNVNPDNPVIGYRSFGEDRKKVADKGRAYMKGLQDQHVLANAKHFPGHGDTDTDSHYALPVIQHDSVRLDSVELYPFRQLASDGLQSLMVAHLQVPAFDARANTPTTLSRKVVTDVLKKDVGFKGLVFTDAMNMQGVAKYYKPGEADVKALIAGNDVILFPLDVPEAIKQVKKALKKKILTQESLDASIKKILKAKYWAGLHHNQLVDKNGLVERLNNQHVQALNHELYQKAITVVNNADNILPIVELAHTSIATVAFGEKPHQNFTAAINDYANVEHYSEVDVNDTSHFQKLSSYDFVVVAYQGITNSPKNRHNVNPEEIAFIKKLQENTKVITVVLGNAYSLQYFNGLQNIICTYEDNAITQKLAPQVIFGAIAAEGKLPVSIGDNFKEGTGIKTTPAKRLSYGFPESVGMDTRTLDRIDTIMENAIRTQATPGGQVLIAKNGKVVFRRNYGYQTYDSLKAVDDNTMYDIASITKVAATMQTLMYLQEKGKLRMNEPVSNYLPELKGTNKSHMILRDILTHQAGLLPFIPYWEKTVEEGAPISQFYNGKAGNGFENEVVDNLYGLTALSDSIWQWTISSELRELPEGEPSYDYKYSDMGYYMFFRLAEKLLQQPLDEFLEEQFYAPLGLRTLTYLPMKKDFYEEIAPTELDNYFRNTLICGRVHDQGAAMIGGIAGHAGLFSNANDLAILMQMNMQQGYYGGKRYFQKKTVPAFSSQQYETNRRGMGWDKPIVGQDAGPTSRYASHATFGHTGFTGTAAWADPEHQLIYIFLSNRVYPDADNAKLLTTNVRTRIQNVIYESIWNFKTSE